MADENNYGKTPAAGSTENIKGTGVLGKDFKPKTARSTNYQKGTEFGGDSEWEDGVKYDKDEEVNELEETKQKPQ